MTTQELLKLLEQHQDKALMFEYAPNKWVDANYHITEVKHITVDSVDCGSQSDFWKETIIQLWESPNEVGKTEFMSVYKALAILKKVGKMKPYSLDSEVKFEYSNATFHTAQLFVNEYDVIGQNLVITLAVEKTNCKAKETCGISTPLNVNTAEVTSQVSKLNLAAPLMEIVVRTLVKDDWKTISHIYADGIATGLATFETKVPDWYLWNEKHIDHCRIVAEINHEVVGFAVLSPVSKREVYKGVAEVSVYVSEKHRGKKIGELLLKRLIEQSESEGFWTLQANIFSENLASIRLHEKCGFRIVGVREKVGKLYGKWHDNHLLERRSPEIT